MSEPRVFLNVRIPGEPLTWERVGWGRRGAFDKQAEAKKSFRWQLKAACPNLKPEYQARIAVRFAFFTTKKSAHNQDIDNFCKFYLDAMTLKGAFGVWADDRQVDLLHARVIRGALTGEVQIVVEELKANPS